MDGVGFWQVLGEVGVCLADEDGAVGKEEDVSYPSSFHHHFHGGDGHTRLAGSSCHDEQSAPIALVEPFGEVAYHLFLVWASGDVAGDDLAELFPGVSAPDHVG